jgi:hypothetical protein
VENIRSTSITGERGIDLENNGEHRELENMDIGLHLKFFLENIGEHRAHREL